jgi:RND superfamily putative drug exporter
MARIGAAGIQGLIGGALGSDSNSALQTVKDANKGGAISATTSAGLQGLGNLSKFVGNRAVNGPAPAAAPPPAQQPLFPPPPAAPKVDPGFTSAPGLRSMADAVRQDPKAAQELMKTVGQVAGPVGGLIGMKTGHDPVTSMATGVLSSALAGPAAKATAKLAPPVLNGAANVVSGLGKLTAGAGNLMSGAGQVAAPLTSDANSLDVPEAALNALQNNRALLGSYAGQFAQAAGSPEPAAVGSLITRLTMTDPRFRTEVLPRLQEAAR